MDILLIDDNAAIRLSLAAALRENGQEVTLASDGNEGMRKLRAHAYDLVISDVRMPGPDGFTILEYTHRTQRATEVILMTAHGAIDDAVSAIKQRATDYLVKPFSPQELVRCVVQIDERLALNQSISRTEIDPKSNRHGLVGRCSGIAYVRSQIDAIAPSEAPVLISGESGTGKELVARALHETSPRKGRPFVAINCASFPHSLLEAELFGYERGAFTGADRARVGRFTAAAAGTLFLDEISEMEASCQAKLLRVLQEKVFSPLGTNKTLSLDARILSATNRPLRALVEARAFREDLYYRVKVLTVDMPPLREREGDLVLLCSHFLRRFCGRQTPLSMSREAWSLVSEYSFPGNVRELEHALQHAVVLARAASADVILPDHLPRELRDLSRADSHSEDVPIQPLGVAAKAFERQYLLRALALCDGNKTRAAKRLEISRKNLWEKLRSQGISDMEIRSEIGTLPLE